MSEQTDDKGVAPVVATITLTERDLVAGIVEASTLFRIRWGVVIIGLFMNLVVWRAAGVHYADGGLSEALIFVAFALFAFLMPWWSARKQLGVLTRAGDANVTYRFDEEGLTTRSAGASSSVAYRRIVKVRQGKEALLIYTTDHVASIIPLRAFSADELARVRAFSPPEAKAKTLRSGTRLVIFWFSLVLAFLVMWQFLSNQGTGPDRAPKPDEGNASP